MGFAWAVFSEWESTVIIFCNRKNPRQLAWIIHELRLVQIRGLAGEDVVFHLESRCNEEDALRSTRLKGKKCRKIELKDIPNDIGSAIPRIIMETSCHYLS